MELLAYLVEIFPTVGFPIICCGVLGWFIYRFYVNSQKQNASNMEQMQARCKEREDKLYAFIKKQSEQNAEECAKQIAVNNKFAKIIAQYEIKLDDIKTDVKVIKDDIAELKAKQA